MDTENLTYRCNCPTFTGKKDCRHTKFIAAKAAANGGNYPMMVRERAEEADMQDVMSSPEKFREFVVNYARIDVL